MVRPPCPTHGNSGTIQLGGHYGRWSEAHERTRYVCRYSGVDKDTGIAGKFEHSFTLPFTARRPTAKHPHTQDHCETCDREYERHDGPKTGEDFLFTLPEIAISICKVAEGMSLRSTGVLIRSAAGRYRVDWASEASLRRREVAIAKWQKENLRKPASKRAPMPTFRKTRELSDSTEVSKESRLVASYIDAFAPIVLAAFAPKKWPAEVGLDSMPISKSGVNRQGSRLQGGRENGEVLIAMDLIKKVPFHVQLAGGKDAESWAAFLRSVPGDPPTFVVADRGPEIRAAVEDVWKKATLYACEGHILKNGQDAADADGIYKWMPDRDNPEETIGSHAFGATKARESKAGHLIKHPVWEAMETAQNGPKQWEWFKEVVEWHLAQPPVGRRVKERVELRKFIANTENLVLAQARWRQDNPGHKRGVGAAESVFIRMKAAFVGRSFAFRNAKRVDLVLRLMCLRETGQAQPRIVMPLLREHFAKHGTRAGVNWESQLDRDRSSSMEDMIQASKTRHAVTRTDANTEREAERTKNMRLAGRLDRVRSGLRADGRSTRPTPRPERRSLAKAMVADIPELLTSWDWDKNGSIDPHTTRATATTRVWWLCQAHTSYPQPHTHSWFSSIQPRARLDTGCPYCANRKVCPSNSLAALKPEVAAEWHPTKNGPTTTDAVAPNKNAYAWWLCSRDPSHVWWARIDARTRNGTGCPIHAAAEHGKKVRSGQVSARADYELGNRAVAREEKRRIRREALEAEMAEYNVRLPAFTAEVAARRAAARAGTPMDGPEPERPTAPTGDENIARRPKDWDP